MGFALSHYEVDMNSTLLWSRAEHSSHSIAHYLEVWLTADAI